MHEPDRQNRIYRGLVSCYPHDFKNRVGESMQTTFADALRTKRSEGRGIVSFLAWTYLDTAMGIMREHRRGCLRIHLIAAAVSVALVVPLMVMEWTTSSDAPRSNFAFTLFVIMWGLGTLSIAGGIKVAKLGVNIRAEGMALRQAALSLALNTAICGFGAWVWIMTVVDQWPCFLGATGC